MNGCGRGGGCSSGGWWGAASGGGHQQNRFTEDYHDRWRSVVDGVVVGLG